MGRKRKDTDPVTMTAAEVKALVRAEWSEAEFQQHVIDLAHSFGWLCAHFRTCRIQRRDGSFYYATPIQADGKGFPDMVLVRERIIWAELKVKGNAVFGEQAAWVAALEKADEEVYVWRPEQWDSLAKILEERR